MENHPACRGRAQIADLCRTFLLYNCFLEGLMYIKIPSLARPHALREARGSSVLLAPPDVQQYHHHLPYDFGFISPVEESASLQLLDVPSYEIYFAIYCRGDVCR